MPRIINAVVWNFDWNQPVQIVGTTIHFHYEKINSKMVLLFQAVGRQK